MRRILILHACVLCAVFIFSAAPGFAESPPPVIVVVDGSASMWEKMDGRDKIDRVREVAARTLEALPAGTSAGLVAFGHRRKGDCGDVEMTRPLGTDPSGIVSGLNDIWPKGKTPLASALEAAAGALPDSGGRILLIGDGWDSCDRDPVRVLENIRASGRSVSVDVLAVAPSDDAVPQLKALADTAGGRFIAANSATELDSAPAVAAESLSRPLEAVTTVGLPINQAPEGASGGASGVSSESTQSSPAASPATGGGSACTPPCGQPAGTTAEGSGDRYGEDCACASLVRVGGAVSGAFQSAGDRDAFRVDAPSGRLGIRTKGAARVTAYDDWCAPVGEPDSSGMLPEGTVFVELGSTGNTGTYSFIIEQPGSESGDVPSVTGWVPDDHGEDCPCATRIIVDSNTPGRFHHENDNDAFRLDVERAGTLVVTTSGTGARGAVHDDFCAPSGELAASSGQVDGTYDVEPGTYFIILAPENGTGDYTLSVQWATGEESTVCTDFIDDDHGNGCPCATPLPLGEEKTGELQYAEDSDAFLIDVPEAGRLAVYTLGSTPTEGVLYDDWCGKAASAAGSGGNGNFRIERDVEPGRVFVSVRHPQDGSGAYRIKAEMLGQQVGAFNLSGTWKWTETSTGNTLGLGDRIETGTAVFTHKGNALDIVYDTGSNVHGTLDGMVLRYTDTHVDEGTTVTEDVRVTFSSPKKGAGTGAWVLQSPVMNGKGSHEIVFEKISD